MCIIIIIIIINPIHSHFHQRHACMLCLFSQTAASETTTESRSAMRAKDNRKTSNNREDERADKTKFTAIDGKAAAANGPAFRSVADEKFVLRCTPLAGDVNNRCKNDIDEDDDEAGEDEQDVSPAARRRRSSAARVSYYGSWVVRVPSRPPARALSSLGASVPRASGSVRASDRLTGVQLAIFNDRRSRRFPEGR